MTIRQIAAATIPVLQKLCYIRLIPIYYGRLAMFRCSEGGVVAYISRQTHSQQQTDAFGLEARTDLEKAGRED